MCICRFAQHAVININIAEDRKAVRAAELVP